MCYALIINRIEQLDKFKILSDMSILEILIFELIKIDKEFYIVANKNFENDIYSTLNKHNYLINTNVHLILLESELDKKIVKNSKKEMQVYIELEDLLSLLPQHHVLTPYVKYKKSNKKNI